MLAIGISCPVFPSEDPERVRQAVLNIFPRAELILSGGTLSGDAGGADHFGEQIRRQRILDSTRSMLIKGRSGDHSVIHLNKQAAYAGKISFTEARTILGTIKVIFRSDDIVALIGSIAPQTVDGEEVRI
ncbi:MAG: hypothetical protein FWF40_00850 [Methanomassiliicoccaceae archaeon]|nr:hypothetical protein [Methanomassiliicoccaceae archaeon]